MQTGKSSGARSAFRHESYIGLLLLFLALTVGEKRSAAQNTSDKPVPETPAVESIWPQINLNVLVTDKHGAPQKVDEQGFRLLEDGGERPLRFLEPADSPVSLALAIDSSGSIYKQKPDILAAVTAIIHALPADSEVMAVLFANNSYLDLPLTPVSKVDFSFLDQLQAHGPSALWDTIVATENHLVAHGKYARKALVILSDGEDNASHLTAQIALQRVNQPDAPTVYACRVDDKPTFLKPDAKAASFEGRRILELLAKRGGGLEFNLEPDPAAVAAQIVAAIRNQYVLQFTAADSARNLKMRKLRVRVPARDLEVHAPPLYYAYPK